MRATKNLGDWLAQNAKPGDLLLSGSSEYSSRFVRWATESQFSHATVIIEADLFTESNDLAYTPSEYDGGVCYITAGDYARRADTLRNVTLLRPRTVDLDRLRAAAKRYVDCPAPYPSLGIAVMGPSKWSAEAVALISNRISHIDRFPFRQMHSGLERFGDRHLKFVGDGPRRIQCAEYAYRLYTDAGVDINLQEPVFERAMERLGSRPAHNPAGREATGAVLDPSHRSIGQVGFWHQGSHPLKAIRNSLRAIRQIVGGLANRLRENTTPDVADFVMPCDFYAAHPFDHISSITLHSKKHPRFPRPSTLPVSLMARGHYEI